MVHLNRLGTIARVGCMVTFWAAAVWTDSPASGREGTPLPRVLIVGDSISIGYTPYVKALLEGRAEVRHNPGNAGHTGMGLEKLDRWLGDGRWDVIHFNWGLWDLAYRPGGSRVRGLDKINGKQTWTPEQYGKNLEQLVKRLRATGASLIWATITPVPEAEPGRVAGDDVKYNAVAAKIMTAHGISINDLYAHMLPRVKEFCIGPDNVHLTSKGYQYLVKPVAASILGEIQQGEVPARRKAKPTHGDKAHRTAAQAAALPTITFRYSEAGGLGAEKGVCRRDPSDVIKVGDTCYVWYSKVRNQPGVYPYPSGYSATVWYATSRDGHAWTERGEALGKGGQGAWDEEGVYTPGILVAKGKYYLGYDGADRPWSERSPAKEGLAVSDSPDGPWKKLPGNPVNVPVKAPNQFDSFRVCDVCLLIRGGKYWWYYKGRGAGKSPRQTKQGVAIADKPEGPYIRYEGNPVVSGGHEVLAWPHHGGVATLIGGVGPAGIRNTIQYAPDGLHFRAVAKIKNPPIAPGGYRPDAFSDAKNARPMSWGISMGTAHDDPYLVRFDCDLTNIKVAPSNSK